MKKSSGRLTIPTDIDVVPETLELMKRWGADAIRDCDGTQLPQELADSGAKVYATYYTTRKDNAWALANPDEIQQCYLMTKFNVAGEGMMIIPLMSGLSSELFKVNADDDIKRWWEVIDRTTGQVVSTDEWTYDAQTTSVCLQNPAPYHEYTVSFLAYLVWDPVHMYNTVVNDWQGVDHQITFDVRQPKTQEYSLNRLRKFLEENPHVDVVRFTTFFHQFMLVFDELKRMKYVDWYGYSASVSPCILRKFEKECGYKFRPEYIIDQGYYNGQYRIPSSQFLDFVAFQRREVASLAKKFVDIVHEYGKEAMMFLGDHWIGTEPYMDEFSTIGLDAVVGSVGNASTTRLISDIEGIRYTEGRLLPYFFPDTFYEGGDPASEARTNWVTARRALLRCPLDRIGYGGYIKLALQFPEFLDTVDRVSDEFRTLYEHIGNTRPYCVKTVAVLNCWGKMRSWGCHMVHHALYHPENIGYAGVIECLAGLPFDVRFLSFDDLRFDSTCLDEVDVLFNIGDAGTAHSGGENWIDPDILHIIRRFIAKGGGFIGVGEPSACQHQGHIFQLAGMLGVEQENGFTLGYEKYNIKTQDHYIMNGIPKSVEFGKRNHFVYALENTSVLVADGRDVKLAVNEYRDGRCVYLSGLPFSFEGNRLLYRAVLWASHSEKEEEHWYTSDVYVDVHSYPQTGKYCVVNNSDQIRSTTVYTENAKSFRVKLAPYEIQWFSYELGADYRI